MKNFLKAVDNIKWEIAGCFLMSAAAECFKLAGYKAKEHMDVLAEAESITRKTSEG